MRRTSRDFDARLDGSRPKKLAPLAKKLVKLKSAVVSVGFSEALSSFFLDDILKRVPNRFFWDPGFTFFEGVDGARFANGKYERDASRLQV